MKKSETPALPRAMEFEHLTAPGKSPGFATSALYGIEGIPGVFRRVARTASGLNVGRPNARLAQWHGGVIELVRSAEIDGELAEAGITVPPLTVYQAPPPPPDDDAPRDKTLWEAAGVPPFHPEEDAAGEAPAPRPEPPAEAPPAETAEAEEISAAELLRRQRDAAAPEPAAAPEEPAAAAPEEQPKGRRKK